MKFEHEVLDDNTTNEIKNNCSNPYVFIRVAPTGMIITDRYLQYAEDILNFQVREDDVWLIAHPRSGTTWLSEMIWLLQNGTDFKKANTVKFYERVADLEVFNVDLLISYPKHLEYLKNMRSPRCIRSHLLRPHLPTELWTKKPKIISVFRNPKDVAISLYHFYKLISQYSGTLELFLKAFLENKTYSSPFWKQVLGLWEMRKEKNVLFLHFDDMKKDLGDVIRKTADFLGVKCGQEEEKVLLKHLSIHNMRKNGAVNMKEEFEILGWSKEENFIREGNTGSWKTIMSPEMIEMFDKWNEEYLEGSDFPRDNL